MKELCNSKKYYLVAQGCRNVISSKNGRYWYEMIGKTQPEMELLEVVAFFYPFPLIADSSEPSVTRIKFFNTASLDFMCSSKFSF